MSTLNQDGTAAAPTAYDVVPYPSGSFPQSHPNRVGAMARLFGINAASPSSARVLELGCADGSNLLPMADLAHGSTFLGIDSSRVQIAAGQQALAASGLKNIELRCQNILEFPASEGKFDYIIAHGILSWVPEPVREKMMQICSAHLAENGVAYVSYNALPGWNMRRSLRDMVQFHTAALKDPAAKIQQMRALVKFLSDSVPTENNVYGLFLKSELEAMSKQHDGYLMHEILEEENAAFYLYDFVNRAARHGLQYLGEPGLSQMLAANFPEKVSETLHRIGKGVVAQEQYMDFLRNRTFRQTLICHASRPINRQVDAARMPAFAFQSLFKQLASPVDLTPGVSVGFESIAGTTVNTTDTFVKAVLQVLTLATPGSMAYQDLLLAAREASRPHLGTVPADRDAIDEATLQSNLLNLCSKGFVDLFAEPINVGKAVPEKPELSPLVRYHAIKARLVANRLHVGLNTDAVARFIIEACDGTRTHNAILTALIARVHEGKLNVKEGEHTVTVDKRLRELLAPQLEAVLTKLTQTGFFPG